MIFKWLIGLLVQNSCTLELLMNLRLKYNVPVIYNIKNQLQEEMNNQFIFWNDWSYWLFCYQSMGLQIMPFASQIPSENWNQSQLPSPNNQNQVKINQEVNAGHQIGNFGQRQAQELTPPRVKEQYIQEYKPEISQTKNKGKGDKLATRNVLPSAVHQILTFIRRKHKSEKIIKQILKKHCRNPAFTEKRYYYYQKTIKDKMGHYLTKDSLKILNQLHDPDCYVYSMEEQLFYAKVSRMLANYVIKYEMVPLLITSSRIKKKLLIEHLRNRRQLAMLFNQILSDKETVKQVKDH